MRHPLVQGIEAALGWSGPERLGDQFARGALPEAGLCARLLTPTRLLDLVMRRSLSAPQIRVFQDGSEIHPARFLDDAVTRRGQAMRTVNMHRLANLLRSGCTLVLDQADVFDATLEVACRALQWWSRELVQVNTYLTTQATDGFPLHWDDHEVVVVQLAGEKDWEVRGCSRVAPMYRDADTNDVPPEDVLWQGTLRAGEVMHIPRGFWHRASRTTLGDGFSLHATFGISKRTGVHWLSWLADNARRDTRFRADLDRTLTGPHKLVHIVGELAEAYRPDRFLQEREAEQGPGRYVPVIPHLVDSQSVVCVTEFAPSTDVGQGIVRIDAAGRRLTFAEAALPALRPLLSGHPVDVRALAQATGLDVAQVVDVLIEEKICAPLTPDLRSGYTDLVIDATCSKPRTV